MFTVVNITRSDLLVGLCTVVLLVCSGGGLISQSTGGAPGGAARNDLRLLRAVFLS